MRTIKAVDKLGEAPEQAMDQRTAGERQRVQDKHDKLMALVSAIPIEPLSLDLEQYGKEIGKTRLQVEWMINNIRLGLKLPVTLKRGRAYIDRLRAPIVMKAAEDWLADYEKRNPAPRPLRVRAG